MLTQLAGQLIKQHEDVRVYDQGHGLLPNFHITQQIHLIRAEQDALFIIAIPYKDYDQVFTDHCTANDCLAVQYFGG